MGLDCIICWSICGFCVRIWSIICCMAGLSIICRYCSICWGLLGSGIPGIPVGGMPVEPPHGLKVGGGVEVMLLLVLGVVPVLVVLVLLVVVVLQGLGMAAPVAPLE